MCNEITFVTNWCYINKINDLKLINISLSVFLCKVLKWVTTYTLATVNKPGHVSLCAETAYFGLTDFINCELWVFFTHSEEFPRRRHALACVCGCAISRCLYPCECDVKRWLAQDQIWRLIGAGHRPQPIKLKTCHWPHLLERQMFYVF